MNWLVDTNIISEIRKQKPNPIVMEWISSCTPSTLFTSKMNIVELRYGASLLKDKFKKLSLLNWIEEISTILFLGRTLEIDDTTLLKWREITRHREILREPAPAVDLLIAAVAIQHGLAIATRDVAPFLACGISTLNPFTGERFNGA